MKLFCWLRGWWLTFKAGGGWAAGWNIGGHAYREMPIYHAIREGKMRTIEPLKCERCGHQLDCWT